MIIRDEAFTHIPSWQLSAQLDLFIALLNSTLTPDVFQTSSPSRVSLNDFCWELAPQYIHEADATHVLTRNEHVGVCLTPRCHIVDMFSYSPAAFYVLAWLVFGGFDKASRDVLLKIGLFAWGTFSDRRQQQPTLTPAPLWVDGGWWRGWWRVMEGVRLPRCPPCAAGNEIPFEFPGCSLRFPRCWWFPGSWRSEQPVGADKLHFSGRKNPFQPPAVGSDCYRGGEPVKAKPPQTYLQLEEEEASSRFLSCCCWWF